MKMRPKGDVTDAVGLAGNYQRFDDSTHFHIIGNLWRPPMDLYVVSRLRYGPNVNENNAGTFLY